MDIDAIQRAAKEIINHPAVAEIHIKPVVHLQVDIHSPYETLNKTRMDVYDLELKLMDLFPGIQFDCVTHWVPKP